MFSADQAAGLRARFARREPQLVPVLDNPAVQGAEGLLDALVGAYLERGLQVLVVDAGVQAQPASELASVNLAACIEALSDQVGWLDARGLILRHLDARGSAARLAERLKDAAPQADVILLRAPAPELARLLAPPQPQSTRPVLLCDLQPDNLRAAYAGMKWLRERAGVPVFALLLSAPPRLPLAERIARQLADCAERFLGAALPDWAAVGPGKQSSAPLRRLARDCLLCEGVVTPPPQETQAWQRTR
ncbi:MAG: flagellar biosynthesis protein [Burkholderiales bacterium]|nr:flagellar biosynthesis protein [Burkholderiales bacterium]